MPVERYSLSSSPSSTLTSRSLCCLRRGKFFPQCTENVNTRGSSLKMKAVPSPWWMQEMEVLLMRSGWAHKLGKEDMTVKAHNILSSRGKKTLPDAHLDPRSEPFFWVRRSGFWLQLPNHLGDKSLNQSWGKRDGFLLLCCRPNPSAGPLQQREQSRLWTTEEVSSLGSVISAGHTAVSTEESRMIFSPVSYRQRLTMPSLHRKPVLLCSCSLMCPFMKLFKYSSVCTQLSKSLEAISGTHTYCDEGNSHK